MKILILGFYSSLRKAELTMFLPLIEELENDKKIKTIFITTPFKYLENLYGELKKYNKLQIIDIFDFLRLIKSILSSDMVFTIYGDALTNRHNFLSQVYNYFLLLLTSIFRKKIALVSNTLFIPAFSPLLRLCSKNIKYCSVRDDRSLFICKKFFEKTSCRLRTDISFTFFKNTSSYKKRGKKLIVCLRNNSHKIAKIKRKEYSKKTAKLIKKMCDTLNLNHVLFLSLDFGIRKVGKDCLIHEDVKRELKGSGLETDLIKCAPNSFSLIREFQSGDIALTSRFHGIIFSISLKKPFLVVDDDYKTFYFMKSHGLENFYITPNDIQNRELINKILGSIFIQKNKLEKIRKDVLKKSEHHFSEIINLINV